MKNIKILPIALALFFSGCLYSCNDWLETGSNDEVLEDDAFSSAKGFRSALIGVYRLVTSENLYGQELTWGFSVPSAGIINPVMQFPNIGVHFNTMFTPTTTRKQSSRIFGERPTMPLQTVTIYSNRSRAAMQILSTHGKKI